MATMASGREPKPELWLEKYPPEILEKICHHLPAPDFYNVTFQCSEGLYNKTMKSRARQTLITRVTKLFSPGSIRAAITLVRLSSLYDPERKACRVDEPSDVFRGLDRNGLSVGQLLDKMTLDELRDLFWLQHVVDMFTTHVMNIAVADAARGAGTASRRRLHPVYLTGISAYEVARAERGFLHSELLLFAAGAGRSDLFRFPQRLPKWEFKELLTAQEFYKGLGAEAKLRVEIDKLHHRKALGELSHNMKYLGCPYDFHVLESSIGQDCQGGRYTTSMERKEKRECVSSDKIAVLTKYPNYAWREYAVHFPYQGLFELGDPQYPNGSIGADQLQAWVGFVDSVEVLKRRQAGWVFWDRARCRHVEPLCMLTSQPCEMFAYAIRPRPDRKRYNIPRGSHRDASPPHILGFMVKDFGIARTYDWGGSRNRGRRGAIRCERVPLEPVRRGPRAGPVRHEPLPRQVIRFEPFRREPVRHEPFRRETVPREPLPSEPIDRKPLRYSGSNHGVGSLLAALRESGSMS